MRPTEQFLGMQSLCGTVRHCSIHLVHCGYVSKPGLREVFVSSLFPSRKKVPQCSHREIVQFSASHSQFNIVLVKEIDYFACFQCQHRDQTYHFPFHRKLLLCVGVLCFSPWSSELIDNNSFSSSFSKSVFSKLFGDNAKYVPFDFPNAITVSGCTFLTEALSMPSRVKPVLPMPSSIRHEVLVFFQTLYCKLVLWLAISYNLTNAFLLPN